MDDEWIVRGSVYKLAMGITSNLFEIEISPSIFNSLLRKLHKRDSAGFFVHSKYIAKFVNRCDCINHITGVTDRQGLRLFNAEAQTKQSTK